MPETERALSSARREYAQALLVIVCSLAWWFSAYLLHGYTFLSEAGQMLWADWVLGRHLYFSDGGVSEWNPYSLFGVDWAGRESFLNPGNLGALLGHLLPGDTFSFMATTMFFLAFMGVSIYAFLRALSIRPRYARLGMIVYLLAPKWLDDGYHGPRFIVGYALLPLALSLILRMAAAGFSSIRQFVLLALLVTLMYLGLGAPFLIIQLYILSSFFVYVAYRRWRDVPPSASALVTNVARGILVAVPLSIGMSAYVLLPFLRSYQFAERSVYGEPPGWAGPEYLGLVFPWVNRLFGRGVYDLPYPAVVPLLAPNLLFYVGILALPVLGAGVARRLWTPMTGFFGAAFIVWLAAWNKYVIAVLPILPWLERLTKGNASQNQGHIILILSMSVILAAVLQEIEDRSVELDKGRAARYLVWLNWSLIVLYVGAALGFLAGALLFATPLRSYIWSRMTVGHFLLTHYYFQEYLALFVTMFLARAAIVWLYHRRYFITGWGHVAMLVLLIADFQLIFRTSYPFTDMSARYSTSEPPNAFVVERTDPLDRIGASQFQVNGAAKADRLSALVALPAPRQYAEVVRRFGTIFYAGFKKPLYEPSFSYFPIVAQRSFYGFHESLMPEYFWDFDKALNAGHPQYGRGSFIGLWDPHSRLLDVAGIKYVFWHEAVADPRFVDVAQYYNESHVYLNRMAVPRAYVVPRVEYYASRPQLLQRMASAGFPPREVVTTEDRRLFDSIPPPDVPASPADARIESYAPDRVVVKVAASRRSVLVLNDMYYPNWTAQVDGAATALYRVNGLFRGVIVPAGVSTVEFSYANAAFHTGVAISAVSWLGTGVLLMTSYWKSRRLPAREAAPVAAS